MRVYKSDRFGMKHFAIIIASLYLLFFLRYNLNYTIYASITLIVVIPILILQYYNRNLSKILLDNDSGIISFIFVSKFGRKIEKQDYKIIDVNCSIYNRASSKGHAIIFKVEFKGKIIWDSSLHFDIDELKNLILHINHYKNNL